MADAHSLHPLLDEILSHEAWAIIRRKNEPNAGLLGGSRTEVASLLDIPVEQTADRTDRIADLLVAVPFRQIRERGFEAHDDGTPLVVVDVAVEHEVPVDELLSALPDVPIEFSERGGFVTSDDDYAAMVEQIIGDEIGHGEGANLVIGRDYRAKLAQWGPMEALTVLRRLIERERGAYWTYVLFTGDRFLVGASPERHVSVRGGDVRMNPISGTFRVKGKQPHELKPALLDFLADEKEIYELFMVVDEELKMMCAICSEGGQVLGPFLKPMTHLVHTEYLLAGRTDRDVREVLRDTMFAATVTGSPVENACRLIQRYETRGRGYYSGALAVFGRDSAGVVTMDSPIVIRTADVDLDGNLTVTAGATLVRDSDPAHETAETHAKANGILSAFGLVPPAGSPASGLADLARDEDVVLALNSRNARLSRFWLTDQAGTAPDPRLRGKRVGILDGEDDFVNMLRHVFGVLGLVTEVVRHDEYVDGCLDDVDLVVVGPGPGDPRDDADPKMAVLRSCVDRLLERGQPFLAVCLGHQALCHRLGIPLVFKDIVFQGTQAEVALAGRVERVGFYNTFVGRIDEQVVLPSHVVVDCDPTTGDVHALTGPHYRGIQFHAESILTEHGYEVLHRLVHDLL
ncbi:anthranilate synthase family protein [Aestuariimicrobium ganziense]|uniref:anthranilate synthase family protein n=1 Tax=Aestuariimicrobium ganziense TaxID=2773677 RepID=UPI00194488D4|nr:anthranilate synthase family protein [Aestuariimicrobium ganziense]